MALIELLEVDDPALEAQLRAQLEALTVCEAAYQTAADEFTQAFEIYDAQMNETLERPSFSWEPQQPRRSKVDSSVLTDYKQTDSLHSAAQDTMMSAKQVLLELLIASQKISEFGRAAFVDALYHAPADERLERAGKLKAQFEELDARLIEDEILCHRGTKTIGFSRVREPGLKVKIVNNGPRSIIQVRTGAVVGETINTNGHEVHVNKLLSPETGLAVYSSSTSSSASWSELLVGEDVMQGFDATLQPAQKLCLAIIARKHAVPLEKLSLAEHCELSEPQLETLKQTVTAEIVSMLVGEKVRYGRVPPKSVFANQKPDGETALPFSMNLRPSDLESMRILAELCGVDKKTVINAIHERINEFDKQIQRDPEADIIGLGAMVYAGLERIHHNSQHGLINTIFPQAAE